MLWLASRIFVKRAAAVGVFGRGPNRKTTIVSVLIALALGAPMYSQLAYLVGLPLRVATPVLLSSLAWLVLVEIARTAAVRNPPLSKVVVSLAAAIALLITLPKLALIIFMST